MIALELKEVEIDYCVSCEGIWLDAGELELLLEDSAARDGFLSSFKVDERSREKPRQCPICDKRMKKALYSGGRKILIDTCRAGHGIWLDKGELREIIEEASYGAGGVVLDLLTALLAAKPQYTERGRC